MKKNKENGSKSEAYERDIIDAARDFVEAADVKGSILYRKDGYILTYLRIFPFNLDLKNDQERKALTSNLAASFKDDRKDFIYFTLPREIDLDKYKNLLKEKYGNTVHIGKRHILAEMMKECAYLTTSGENFEHQHFIKIWKKASMKDKKSAEADLLERINDFKIRYQGVGIECQVLNEPEIVKLCNLFGNSLQASFESVDKSAMYTPILQL